MFANQKRRIRIRVKRTAMDTRTENGLENNYRHMSAGVYRVKEMSFRTVKK